jgi:tryptophanyl-tRNA synthetase
MYGEPKQDLLVPVGEDQAPHVELTREIVRAFNFAFGFSVKIPNDIDTRNLIREQLPETDVAPPKTPPLVQQAFDDHLRRDFREAARKAMTEWGYENFREKMGANAKFFTLTSVLQEPAYIPTETPRLPGLDGRRMAKSYGNAIWLTDPPDEIRTKTRNMLTDPQRVRRTDPGRPEICPVFAYHKLFSPPGTVVRIDRDCRSAAIGCVDCKKEMAENLVKWIEPIQARRKQFEANPQQVWDILDTGSKQAQKVARKTMKRVRNAIFQWDEARQSSNPARAGKVATGE